MRTTQKEYFETRKKKDLIKEKDYMSLTDNFFCFKKLMNIFVNSKQL